MEYNVDLKDGLDLYQENSLTLILKQIRPGSNILEFGPAYGRMTKHLKEKMGCHVSCVEINPNAEETLREFADKVVIGNIEDYDWIKTFKVAEFDYIIFADVLEHLFDPERALREVIPFLKVNGRIFISVPNISHNAVIESLYLNKFEYQESGILDRTHLKFFTKSSLEALIESVGLDVCSKKATYYSVTMTGILDNDDSVAQELKWLLEQRPFSDVYQFVYCVCKSGSRTSGFVEELEEGDGKYTFKLYLDTGNGFSENQVYESNFNIHEQNEFQFVFGSEADIKRLRIDPIDVGCVCTLDELKINDEDEVSCVPDIESNCKLRFQNKFLFDHNDPQIIISGIKKKILSIKIRISILPGRVFDNGIYQFLNVAFESKQRELENKENEFQNMQKICLERGEKVAELTSQLEKNKAESNERATLLSEILSQNALIKREAEERALKIAQTEGLLDMLQCNLKEIQKKNNELEMQNEIIKQESEERAQKIAQIEVLLDREKCNLESALEKNKILERKAVEALENHRKRLFKVQILLLKYLDEEIKHGCENL